MKSLQKLQDLLNSLKKEILQDPERNFSLTHRLELFNSFGRSACPNTRLQLTKHIEKLDKGQLKLSTADKVVAWQAILSVQHLLPIYERGILNSEQFEYQADFNFSLYATLPHKTLDLASNVLKQLQNVEEVWLSLNNDFYYATLTVNAIYNYPANCVYKAACEALSMALGIRLYGNYLASELFEETPKWFNKETELVPSDDCLSNLIRAYTVTNVEPEHKRNNTQVRKYSNAKRLEFWEWWLMEAIPQAWELAHSS
jgi:hypothetical protein